MVGYFTFDNEYRRLDDLTTQTTDGCATKRLTAGFYEVAASYYQGPVCSNTSAGCKADRILIEIVPDGFVELDFEVVPAGSVRE